jgi:hypothetical protein
VLFAGLVAAVDGVGAASEGSFHKSLLPVLQSAAGVNPVQLDADAAAIVQELSTIELSLDQVSQNAHAAMTARLWFD